jgi:hypothetical protein
VVLRLVPRQVVDSADGDPSQIVCRATEMCVICGNVRDRGPGVLAHLVREGTVGARLEDAREIGTELGANDSRQMGIDHRDSGTMMGEHPRMARCRSRLI